MPVKTGRISADPDTALTTPAPVLLRFAAHFGLALCTLGLLPEPYDTSARLRYQSQQVCQHTGFCTITICDCCSSGVLG